MSEVPYWYNEESECILNRGYLLRGEDVNGAIERISSHASNKLNRPEMKEKFKEMIFKGWVSLSSPIWSNMWEGKRGLPISCYGSYLGDSMESIVDKLAENAILTKMGGGTSSYFGRLRPRGTPVSQNGDSSGPISFMQMFDTMISCVSQGS